MKMQVVNNNNKTRQDKTRQDKLNKSFFNVNKDPILLGGLGEKKSNGGTQWFLQNRIYFCEVCITVTTCCMPYFLVIE